MLVKNLIMMIYDDDEGSQTHRLQFPTKLNFFENCFGVSSVDPDEVPHYWAFHLSLHCFA